MSIIWRYAFISIVCIAVPVTAKELTLLYTNDIESVYEPVTAFWLADVERVGGIANLSTLINEVRLHEPISLLLDAGDIFTGSLSKATLGKLAFDIYSAMGYDAVNLGNHEFEYGSDALRNAMQRARFPVLSANIFYSGTDVTLAQSYTIREVAGVRVGIIGAMGIDAFINTMMASNRAGLEVRSLKDMIQPLVDQIRDEVDMVVILTHQNATAPMQTDKEADPEVQRGYLEDYELAGQLKGVDMIIGGHSDHGLWQPVVHPDTGTYIGMTFGQGKHLGYAKFDVARGKPAKLLAAELIVVDSDRYPANPKIKALIDAARAEHPWLAETVGSLDKQAVRKYYAESTLGNLLADMLRDATGADVGFVPSGAIRADLEAGDVSVEQVLNVFPFTDTVSVVSLPGNILRQVIEKSLALDYGIVQLSGVELSFDKTRPAGHRLLEVNIGAAPLDSDETYTLVTGSFTATGGENYSMFAGLPVKQSNKLVSEVFVEYFRKTGQVKLPDLGRQFDLERNGLSE